MNDHDDGKRVRTCRQAQFTDLQRIRTIGLDERRSGDGKGVELGRSDQRMLVIRRRLRPSGARDNQDCSQA
ncbi:hypothetical protein BF95_02200 [Sphingobium sp. Ant17]|nr:hypothetical protein BF95_02200 [Sphingobium sp. Ant17]